MRLLLLVTALCLNACSSALAMPTEGGSLVARQALDVRANLLNAENEWNAASEAAAALERVPRPDHRVPDPTRAAAEQRVINAKPALEAARMAFVDSPDPSITNAEKLQVLEEARAWAESDYNRHTGSLSYYAVWGPQFIQDQQVRVDQAEPSNRPTQEIILNSRKNTVADLVRIATADRDAALAKLQTIAQKVQLYST